MTGGATPRLRILLVALLSVSGAADVSLAETKYADAPGPLVTVVVNSVEQVLDKHRRGLPDPAQDIIVEIDRLVMLAVADAVSFGERQHAFHQIEAMRPVAEAPIQPANCG